jgi:hypothetical protein
MKKLIIKFYDVLISWGEVLYEYRQSKHTKDYY